MNNNNKILSDITVHMKYAKYIPELNRRETWEELVTRNKEMHQKKYPKLKNEIERVYKMVYDKKVLPSMRSMQFGGRPIPRTLGVGRWRRWIRDGTNSTAGRPIP